MTGKKQAWEVVAQYGGRDAGHVATVASKAEAQAIRMKQQMTCRVSRVLLTPQQHESLPWGR